MTFGPNWGLTPGSNYYSNVDLKVGQNNVTKCAIIIIA